MNPEIVSYFNHLGNQFWKGKTALPIISKKIKIGAIHVQFNFIGEALIPTFFDVFRHLEISNEEKSISKDVLIINLWDQETTEIGVDSVPWQLETPHHLGLIESFTSNGYFTLQQPGSYAIYMFDKTSNTAYYHVSKKSLIPFWESDFPLRMVLHWFFNETALQPVHSAAIGTEKSGVLLVGKGGSGKSTTTLSCLNSVLKIAGDDYILLDTENYVAHSLFSLCKVATNSLALLKHHAIKNAIKKPAIEGKFRISLFEEYPESLIKSIPINAILLPTVTKNKVTKIVAGSSAKAMIALAPTTLFQLPGLREEAFKKMGHFVRQVPAYELQLGSDVENIPSLLNDFITQQT
jgi:energy-coupling factor transporter ATP-binding protein EcfA2